MISDRKRDLGRRAENFAAELLESLGWAIVERNWRRKGTEIDLICSKDDSLLFVEVKTRTNAERSPQNFLNSKKIQALRRGIELYLSTLDKRKCGSSVQVRLALVTLTHKSRECAWLPLEDFF